MGVSDACTATFQKFSHPCWHRDKFPYQMYYCPSCHSSVPARLRELLECGCTLCGVRKWSSAIVESRSFCLSAQPSIPLGSCSRRAMSANLWPAQPAGASGTLIQTPISEYIIPLAMYSSTVREQCHPIKPRNLRDS